MSFAIVALVVLVFVIIYQIAKASEYAAVLKGEERSFRQTNRTVAWVLVAMFFVGMWGIWECHQAMMPKMLNDSASEEGVAYDNMFKSTLIMTGIVFFLTQACLIYFTWKYQNTEKKTSFFYPHNNKIELIWTIIPAIAMAVLVAGGLKQWLRITDEAPANSQVVEIIGKQFNWVVRYPGADKVLGKRYFTNINDANNVIGLDWKDNTNMDDIISEKGELHIVKGRPVKLIIGARDVIHDVGLPHFRLKMDAVPGITTTMWFTPRFTNAEMAQKTGNANFVYEISCDQMCGKGHYSMRGTVIVHDNQADFDTWMKGEKSYYASMVAKPAPASDSTGGAKPAVADSAATAMR